MLFQRLFTQVSVAARNISSSKPALATFTVQDETEFKEKVLGSAIPIVVDNSATSKLLTPRLDAAIAATKGAVVVAIVDIKDGQQRLYKADKYDLDPAYVAIRIISEARDRARAAKFLEMKREESTAAAVAAAVKASKSSTLTSTPSKKYQPIVFNDLSYRA